VIECPRELGGCGISLDTALEANHLRSAGGKHLEEYQKTLTGIDGSRTNPTPAKTSGLFAPARGGYAPLAVLSVFL
jgi:hypothetical protein